MARNSEIIGAVTIAAFLGLAAGLALTPAPADAGYGMDTASPVSNISAKSDLLLTGGPVPVNRKILPAPVEVTQVQILGEPGASVVLLDASGRIVYRSTEAQQVTTVTRDVVVPSTSELRPIHRIDSAFRAAGI
jgi:hypothetical protein